MSKPKKYSRQAQLHKTTMPTQPLLKSKVNLKAAGWASWYKQLFLRLSWPLRIMLLPDTMVVGGCTAFIAIVETLFILAVILFIGLAIFKSGNRGGSPSTPDWKRADDEWYQEMMPTNANKKIAAESSSPI